MRLFLCLRDVESMAVQVCETVTGRDMAELLAARDAVVEADLVELRLDGVRDVDVAGAVGGRRRPVVVTCRPVWEGGRFDGAEEDRLALLRDAARLGAEYVDVEWRARRELLSDVPAGRVVLSHHAYDAPPDDLPERIRAMRAGHAGIVKVAVHARRLTDVLRLRAAFDVADSAGPHVAIAMGPSGLTTRLHPSLFGSCWTYAGQAAPGQLPARDLADRYRVRRTSPASAFYGVVGQPVGHSASPAMHNAAFAALALDAVYIPLESADADDVVTFAEAVGIQGLSVTAPLKEALSRRATPADALVARTGAANTLRWSAGGLEARNFDVDGFLAPLLRRRVALAGHRAVVLGGGGAARAVTVALQREGAEVAVTARRAEAADAIGRDLGVQTTAWPPTGRWDLLVHATPVGTWPHEDASLLAAGEIRSALVYDLVYNPRETRLMRAAREAGAAVIGGLEMLVAQAACQCRWWTGRTPDEAILTQAAEALIDSAQVTTP